MQAAAASLARQLGGGLVVSCQPVPGGPFDDVAGVLAFARAAASAGARGLRIEGAVNVAAVVRALDLPVIGLIKHDLPASAVRITPLVEDVAALAAAGSAIIAIDATDRPRPVSVATLVGAVHEAGMLAMADCATLEEARRAIASGADLVGSTMSGYTGEGPVPDLPDLELVRALAGLGVFVLAEGRYNTPALAAEAIRLGATAVVVGSAITRPEHVTEWFCDALAAAAREPAPVVAFDIGGTKTLAALVQGKQVFERRQVPTDRDVGAPGWAQRVASLADGWSYGAAAIAATGVVLDGVWRALNPDVLRIPPCFPLADALRAALGVPVFAMNDAQAWAWGEYRHGAGAGRNLLFVTVSSGIGGGVVAGDRLLSGARGLAGSLGQVPTGEGRSLEAIASGFAMARAARALGHEADVPAIFRAAANGAEWADELLARSAESLARALVGAQTLLDPECIVLGGGVGLAPGYLTRVASALDRHAPMLVPCLRPAALGADGGIIGVADYAAARQGASRKPVATT